MNINDLFEFKGTLKYNDLSGLHWYTCNKCLINVNEHRRIEHLITCHLDDYFIKIKSRIENPKLFECRKCKDLIKGYESDNSHIILMKHILDCYLKKEKEESDKF